MGFDMERRRSMCFEHSDEEDEDHMRRISMCFSIDISDRVKKQNRFHNQVTATDRNSRNPGGGLFGNVKDSRPKRSFSSFTVPNKFFADGRDVQHRYDKYNGRSTEYRRMPDSWSRDHYDPDSYQRYNNRQITMESYDYSRPLKSLRTERNYNSPRYEEPIERPRKKHYPQRNAYGHEALREPIPGIVLKKKTGRPEKLFEKNVDHYNCNFPTKHLNNYVLHEFSEPNRNSHRRKSGYSGRDYEPYYETIPRANSESCYYNNRPTTREYDSEYYGYKSPPIRMKSVEFFDQDCEIPYNILKRPRNIERRNRFVDNQPCLRLSSVDIPYKKAQETMF
ncbi:uncharacterized protein LOC117779609 [Drosophila innubila]|uniref:uncharacterized protein LOC117779609 n=1 Tax=Drosophila innubila TaxID=198719 RepID=UPI00148E31A9|nr:uncharacterized protein LOC117779609 [Drosophila innubila]